MRSVATILRNMALLSALALLISSASPASASTQSQMLPPTSGNTPCLGILTWDGSGNVTCAPGLIGDVNTGSVTQNGSIVVNQNLYLNGYAATLGDGNSTVVWKEVADICTSLGSPAGGNVSADTNGNLHCCPLGQVATATYADHVDCGLLKNTP